MSTRLRIPKSNVVTGPLTAASRTFATTSASTAGAFVLILVALHAIEPEFDPSWRFISEYQLGGWGWLMSLAFVCLSVSATTLVLAARSQIRTVGGRIGLGLLALSAVAFLVAGVFRTDSLLAETATTTGMIHNTAAAVGGFVPLAAYLIAWSLARNVAWRAYRPALWWVTVPAIVGDLAAWAQNAVLMTSGGAFGPGTPVGWPNRLLIVGFAVWMLVAALLVRVVARAASDTADASDTAVASDTGVAAPDSVTTAADRAAPPRP
ncbi:DUF998 domain-containing protein [Agromyces bauzanensis]